MLGPQSGLGVGLLARVLGVGLGQETGCWVLGLAGRPGVGCRGGPLTPLSGENKRARRTTQPPAREKQRRKDVK